MIRTRSHGQAVDLTGRTSGPWAETARGNWVYASLLTGNSHRDVLGQGSKKNYVSAVQRALDKRGYDVTIDGEYGPETYNAVRQFQSNNGLSVDGKVEPQTGAALFG